MKKMNKGKIELLALLVITNKFICRKKKTIHIVPAHYGPGRPEIETKVIILKSIKMRIL